MYVCKAVPDLIVIPIVACDVTGSMLPFPVFITWYMYMYMCIDSVTVT